LILGLTSFYINFVTREIFFFFIKTYQVDLTSQKSIRTGDIVGDHKILYAGPGERIELKHQAHSRECFANGTIKTIKFIVQAKENKIYSTNEVLGL
jgi:dihydrodipicolinate reductase